MIGGVHIARIRSLVWGIYNVLATRVHSMVLGCICIVIDINDDRLSHRKNMFFIYIHIYIYIYIYIYI